MFCLVDAFVCAWVENLSHLQVRLLLLQYNLIYSLYCCSNKVSDTTQVTQLYYLAKYNFIHLVSVTFGPMQLQFTVPLCMCVRKRGWRWLLFQTYFITVHGHPPADWTHYSPWAARMWACLLFTRQMRYEDIDSETQRKMQQKYG